MSSSRYSGRYSRASARPDTPSCATLTVWPSFSSSMRSALAASLLSSITRTRRGVEDGRSGRATALAGPSCAGSRTMNSLPRSAPALRASTVPPCRRTSRCTSVSPMPRPPCGRCTACWPCLKRSKAEPSSSGAARLDGTAVQAHQPLHQREPDAEAALRPLHRLLALLEKIESGTQQLRVHAHAVVLHADHGFITLAQGADGDLAALGGIARRVVQQLVHDLCEARLVREDGQRLVRQLDRETVAARLDPLHRALYGPAHHGSHVERLPVERDRGVRDARDVEQVVDQAGDLRGLAMKHFAHPLLIGVGGLLEREQVERIVDRRERIAQLVREHCEELARAALGLLQPFGPLAVGDVADHVRVAHQHPLVVVEGAHDQVGPEGGAVLAQPRALDLEAPVLPRHGELLLREPLVDRRLRIEHREVAPGDFLRRVAGDALRAAVPARDASVGVEHENRVVLVALDEDAEALLALAEGFLLSAALGQVARALRESAQRPALVVQRRDHHVGPEPAAVLAYAPAFVLEPAALLRHLQLALRAAALDRLRRIEHGEVPTQDLGLGIAILFLGAAVPRHDVARAVEQANGVVLHAVHELPVRIREFERVAALDIAHAD